MGNSLRIQRVVYRHDWQCLADWPRALDELAELTDDEIDRLVHSDPHIQQTETA
jgi:hypothetical protein